MAPKISKENKNRRENIFEKQIEELLQKTDADDDKIWVTSCHPNGSSLLL